MADSLLRKTLHFIAEFYNACKVGYVGHEGYRKSTDLVKFGKCVEELKTQGHIDPEHTIFLDLGCGDGRVNVFMSYFVKNSIGIEIDSDILAEYVQRKESLLGQLRESNLLLPPDNITLLHGSSLDDATYEQISRSSGIRFSEIDMFYTYITLHDLFAEKIAKEARKGALYLVYGFSKVLPCYDGLEVVSGDLASQKIVALYSKG
jgi:hypothetical protein